MTEPPYPVGNGAPVPMSLYLSDRERDQRDREQARRDQDRQFDRISDDVRQVGRKVDRGFEGVEKRLGVLEDDQQARQVTRGGIVLTGKGAAALLGALAAAGSLIAYVASVVTG